MWLSALHTGFMGTLGAFPPSIMLSHHVLAAAAVLLFGLAAVVLALNGQDTYAVISVSVLALTVSTLGLLAGPDWGRIEADVARMRELAEQESHDTPVDPQGRRRAWAGLVLLGALAWLVVRRGR